MKKTDILLLSGLMCCGIATAQSSALLRDINKQYLGDSYAVRSVGQTRSLISPDALLRQAPWLAREQTVVATGDVGLIEQLQAENARVGERLNQSNRDNVAARKISGDFGERLMDKHFVDQGWEKLNSKVGVQGLDGMYVRRDSNGRIIEYQPAEAKTGDSQLNMTKAGKQATSGYVNVKIKEMIASAQKQYDANPTPANKRYLQDCQALQTAKGHPAQVFRAKYVTLDGKTYLRTSLSYADGTSAGTTKYIDMTKDTVESRAVKRALSASVEEGMGSAKLAGTMNKLESGFKSGRIASSGDVNWTLKNEIHKPEPVKMSSLAPAKVAKGSKSAPLMNKYGLATASVGILSESMLILTHDILRGNVTWDTAGEIAKLGVLAGATELTLQYSGTITQLVAQNCFNVTDDVAKSLASVTSKTLGAAAVGLQAIVGGYMVYDYISQYNAGEITLTDMSVKGSLVAVSVVSDFYIAEAGFAFPTSVGVGAGAGILGGVVGAIGPFCGVGIVVYDYFAAEARAEAAFREQMIMAGWEDEHRRQLRAAGQW
ncbi:MAG: hypothetical protein II295_09930 [Akkermansia sp.]|nr:hypothetical protein [Akkermansia sp.]